MAPKLRQQGLGMVEQEGIYYLLWRLVFPALRILIRRRPGEFALSPPSTASYQAYLGPGEPQTGQRPDEHHEWWRLNLWANIRQVIGSGKGGIATISFGDPVAADLRYRRSRRTP